MGIFQWSYSVYIAFTKYKVNIWENVQTFHVPVIDFSTISPLCCFHFGLNLASSAKLSPNNVNITNSLKLGDILQSRHLVTLKAFKIKTGKEPSQIGGDSGDTMAKLSECGILGQRRTVEN